MDADNGMQMRGKLDALEQGLRQARERLVLLSQRAARLGAELEASAALRASMQNLSEKAREDIAARSVMDERDEWADDGRFLAMASWEIALVGEDSHQDGAPGRATEAAPGEPREGEPGDEPSDPSSRA